MDLLKAGTKVFASFSPRFLAAALSACSRVYSLLLDVILRSQKLCLWIGRIDDFIFSLLFCLLSPSISDHLTSYALF